ncbi:NAD-dependent protein deacetylase [Herbaspirillum sp. SJZ107]|uniref:NAD-dependent protein deacetylase n=1 Tax=Herbaspirillum sp. SJZ107 TaxID=2572881 RepID=UPI00114DCFFA|nr:NAD-dependent protein deacetylase [Herbaspirillum sp. SJZ107]TQK11566.1 NAD-dependent SIR2 family protein deacetylase [Herbaspirillum sp. SJZ107]
MAEAFTTHDHAARIAEFLDRHPHALVLTGAGLSTASGIPDYRDRDGTRRGKPPIHGPDFRKSEFVQRRYWARSMIGWPVLSRAQPNAGHIAIAGLEAIGRIGSVLTQNVDGLHGQAGSHAVLELHGNIHTVVCLACAALFPRAFIQKQLEDANPQMLGANATPLPDGDASVEPTELADFRLPWCTCCGGTLMPNVVFFGDNVPPARTTIALAQMERADALLVVGSSLMVYSGFRFCRMSQASGKPIAAINLGRTRADDLLDIKIEDSSERVLPLALQLLGAGRRPSDLPPLPLDGGHL